MARILIGPAGSGGNSPGNFGKIRELGLEAVEAAFTYGVRMTVAQAGAIRKANKRFGLKLSVHAPYYINLNAEDNKKKEASMARILKSAEIGHCLGAAEIVFHPGFYMKDAPEEAYETIEKSVKELCETVRKNRWRVVLAPETSGKPSQFGSLDELIRLRRSSGCGMTVDFAHLKARNNGILDYPALMKTLKAQEPFHTHFSGIEYSARGEIRHKKAARADIAELLKNLLGHGISTTVINESPRPVEEALRMKQILEKLPAGGAKNHRAGARLK